MRISATAVFLLTATLAVAVPSQGAGTTAIDTLYQAQGGSAGALGAVRDKERCGLRAGGCFRAYEHGSVYWSPQTGAQPVQDPLAATWHRLSAQDGALGYPVRAMGCSHGTCSQDFERGSLAWTADTGTVASQDTDDPASIFVLVNKQHALAPADYRPEDLVSVDGSSLRAEAAEAFGAMQAAAAKEGVGLKMVSAFRSFDTQSSLYRGYVEQHGSEQADTFSARPGFSEHQTGLALDIADAGGTCTLQACFESTAAGTWAASNASDYGFIIRYPAGSEAVTGYSYEPWHLRYVGVSAASALRTDGIATWEEFLSLPPAPGY
ncbi:D-alanyl-D-alanine carboxypeptidase family protein [Arthrobacter sp. zg-Y40]|uniref:D-alanyl-D-alanine carboxypeptidase family protein n=1 Tax=Arthrobacter sp. zg-Y40 TaxID=2886939 RepID=UPI001D13A353|nr:D-alanyl-D-alanine carboxypeptidase family protein [Arthrobacter sp. zg-Y40]MCC3277708.1 D-alanyl-D-alanine carboxypeptidase family protein [Arthrobacter sp. zg-Y40]